jgi:predicted ArsR family transcriptional regulator
MLADGYTRGEIAEELGLPEYKIRRRLKWLQAEYEAPETKGTASEYSSEYSTATNTEERRDPW